MNGRDFITAASRWVARSNADEADFRSAISRSYYGAFHLAKELLEALGFEISMGANGHGQVRFMLLESGQKQAVDAGRFLKDLHAERIKADYRLDKQDAATRRAAQVAVETAADTDSLISACSKEPNRTELKTGIENYQQTLAAGRAAGPPS